MWTLQFQADHDRRRGKFAKNSRRELVNLYTNLNTYHEALNAGIHPEKIKREYPFVHSRYKQGLVSIDQRGPTSGKGKLKLLRLYLFPHMPTKRLHVITLGDKSTQAEDIKRSNEFVEGILKGKIAE